jgi:hypothetical protein
MAYIFQDLAASAKNIDFKTAKEARDWYRQQAMSIGKVSPEEVMANAGPFKLFQNVQGINIGKMYMFFYDAKTKDKLPFFDMFPLVFPIEMYTDGFLGLNLHYLPPMDRASLMDNLYTLANNQKYNTTTKLTISYQTLKAYSNRFGGYQNCMKRYLFGQIRSPIHYVNPTDWDKALMLPVQRWHINPNKKYLGAPPY